MELNNSAVDCEASSVRNFSDKNTANLTVKNALVDKEQRRLLFGWLHYRPDSLQGLLSPKWALFWLCWAGAVQGRRYSRMTITMICLHLLIKILPS